MVILPHPHQDPGSTVQDVLQLLDVLVRGPDDECVEIVQPGGDKSVDFTTSNGLFFSFILFLKAAKPALSSTALPQTNHRKRNQHQTSSSSHPHPGPSSILLSDASMTPWGGLALSESSFTSIPPPLPPSPAAPRPTPAIPYCGRRNENEEVSSSTVNSEVSSPLGAVHQGSAGMLGRNLRVHA